MASHGIKHINSMPCWPESQGIVERFHQSLSSTLAKLQHESGRTWKGNLPYMLFALQHSPSETLGCSLFELLYAHSMRGLIDILHEAWAEPHKANWAKELLDIQNSLRAAWAIVQANEAAAQERVKIKFDHKTKTRSFAIGDEVLVPRIRALRPLETQLTGPHKILGK
ncbi:uncharacterized protein [Macrobrachium rosenbergii]|uniref:uncharacterized protein n=1 Tax=Macrobrachium rosenbergii TaxID=79674 RepID=UPI0034D6069D